jgi:hypothetical protein
LLLLFNQKILIYKVLVGTGTTSIKADTSGIHESSFMPIMKRILWLAAFWWLLSACMGQKLDSWLGKPIDDYFRRNGPPDKSMTLKDGTIVHTYKQLWGDVYGNYTCVINLNVDNQGLIQGYTYHGC